MDIREDDDNMIRKPTNIAVAHGSVEVAEHGISCETKGSLKHHKKM